MGGDTYCGTWSGRITICADTAIVITAVVPGLHVVSAAATVVGAGNYFITVFACTYSPSTGTGLGATYGSVRGIATLAIGTAIVDAAVVHAGC